MAAVRTGFLEGWRLTGVLSLILVAAIAALSFAAGGGIEGIRFAVRNTAWTSAILFLLAFTASSFAWLMPSPWTKWQLRNRRYLGVSFAVSHLIHAIVLLLLFRADSALFWTLTKPANVAAGSSAYLVILLMAATSFDRAVAWIGPRQWRVLHKFGAWYIWIFFVINFGKRIPMGNHYIIPVVVLLLASGVRALAWHSKRRGRIHVAQGAGG